MSGYGVDIERIDDAALINLRCDEEVASHITRATSIELPQAAFKATQSGNLRVACLAPDQWWIRTTLTDEQATFEALKDATRNLFAAVTIITDHFQGFKIEGQDTSAILSQASSIDFTELDSGAVTRGKFARSGGTFFVITPAETVEVFVESSYADYVQVYLTTIAGQTDAATQQRIG